MTVVNLVPFVAGELCCFECRLCVSPGVCHLLFSFAFCTVLFNHLLVFIVHSYFMFIRSFNQLLFIVQSVVVDHVRFRTVVRFGSRFLFLRFVRFPFFYFSVFYGSCFLFPRFVQLPLFISTIPDYISCNPYRLISISSYFCGKYDDDRAPHIIWILLFLPRLS